MPTLFLLAPHRRNQPSTNHRDFHTIIANSVGPDYGISSRLIGKLTAGMPVVVFDRDRRLQAAGIVAGYTATKKAGNGVQRYDVSVRGLTTQQYTKPPKVSRFGVEIY